MSLEALLKIQKKLTKMVRVNHNLTPLVYGYIRTSKSEREHKYSSDYQERLIKDYFERLHKLEGSLLYGTSWGGVFLDRVSGKTKLVDRTAGRVMMNRLLPGDFLVCYNLDRMSRSMWDSANLFQFFMECKIRLLTVDGEVDLASAAGQTMAMIKIGFAQMERERISERTKRGLEERRLVKRKWTVNHLAPPGWRRSRVRGEWRHVKCKAARLIAEKIVVWRDQEKMSWYDIGYRMRRRRITYRSAKTWERHTVMQWYDAAKAGYPNNSAFQRENLPPLTIELPDTLPAASEPSL